MKGVIMKKKICLLVSLIILFTVMCVTQLEADWTYKRPIEINNGGGALTDYQVLVTLTEVIMGDPYTHVNTDGSDIRFSTGDNVDPMPYWIESWDNTGTSKIWVKAPNIGTGTTTPFNMYYGNSGASSASSGTNTFEFFDDFEDNDISDWTTVSGSPAVSGGMISVGANVEFEISKPSAITVAIWEFDYQYPNGPPAAGSAIQLYTQWVSAGNYYYLDRTCHLGRRRLGRLVSGSDLELIYSSIGWDTNWHTLKLTRNSSGNFELFEDGGSLGTVTDASHTTSNEIHLRSMVANHPGVNVDNIRVRKYASPEPGASVGSESGGDYTLPVELSTFTAQFLNNVPTLYWKTESETDNIGWYVYRNTKDDFEDANRISGFIEGYGTTSEPHHYIYEDVELNGIPGEAYWYWIESVDLGGAFHRYSPAVLNIPDISHPNPYQNIPKQYGLHQNEPNPLSIRSSSTRISFLLPKTARVEVKIYNIRGELVKDLYNGIAYGDDEVKLTWDGRDENGVAQVTGIYLYQLKVNGKTYEVKRLILLR